MNVSSWLEATFCSGGDHLWSADDLWNTEVPVFSRCLLKTVPVWAPALVLTLCAPLQTALLWSWHRSHRAYPIALNAYNVGRMVVTGLLITLSLVHLGYDYIVALDYDHGHGGHDHDHQDETSHHNLNADLSSSLVNAFVFSLFLFLINLHRLTGQHTSALAFYFTALLLVFTFPTIYMLSMYFWHRDTFRQQFNGGGPAEAAILVVETALKLLLFLYTCFADRARLVADVDEEEPEEERGPLLEPYPESGVSFLSKHTYWWFNPLARLGFSKTLKAEDVWDNQPNFKARHLAAAFERCWRLKADRIAQRSGQGHGRGQSRAHPGVLSVLLSTFGFTYLRACLFQLISLTLIFIGPQLLKQIIAFISEKDAPLWHGYLLATALFATYALNSLVFVYFIRRICAIGNAVKNSLVTAIYRKALRLSSAARRQATTGQIVNLMSTDARQFNSMIMALDDVWVAPTQISLSTFFLWNELGVSALAGIGAMVTLLPLNWWFSRVEQRAVKKQKAIMDERVNLTSETIAGIRVIKLYGWEGAFIEKISAVRLKEIAQLRIISLFNALTSFTWNLAPFLVAFSTFAVFVLSSTDHILDAKKAFICLTLFTMLQYPLGALPQVINKMVETATSIQRLDRYFAAEELENYIQEEEDNGRLEKEDDEQVDIRMEKATLSWGEAEAAVFEKDDEKDDKDKKKKKEKEKERKSSASSEESSLASSTSSSQPPPLNLTSIDLRIARGSLVAIVGRVGAGKSSLLSAILGEMQLTGGRVKIAADRAISYVAQQAWIQNATLRENILFGGRYDEARYQAVLKMCALGPDLAILPGGDQTEIGEKGINLSGGQKQRVALGRACYAPGDIFLFDDPLSAVDSHVAKHLFTHVLSSETGFLRDKTRVIATNNVAILPEVDQIVVLTKGAVSEVGTYEQLMATEGGAFAAFMREHAKQAVVEEGGDDNHEKTEAESEEKKKKKKVEMERQLSQKAAAAEKDVLIEEEKAEEGDVKMSVYLNYFKSLRVTWLLVLGLSWLAMQVAYVGTDLWLAIWSSDAAAAAVNVANSTSNSSNSAATSLRNERLAVYGVLGFSHNLLYLVGWIALAFGSAASSVTLHRQLLFRIMRSPMSFFDTTPLGRIINRFSKDLSTIDSRIRFALEGWVICLLQVFSLIIMIVIQIPLLAVVVVIVAILYYMIQRYYIATYRQLSRLESVTSSPIFSHFAESLSGMATIRAFSHQRRFIRTSNRHVDLNQRVWWAMIAANRWMSVRMELCGNLVVLFAAVIGVASRASFADRPGYFGLIISYAMSITGSLKWLVRNSCEMETSIVSVERIGEYSELPMEAAWTRAENAQPRLPANWPTEGQITLERLSIRYRAGLEPVLQGISLDIKAGEKVGVIGRTGAGKSTITLALFRILEASSAEEDGFDGGRITIDGVDISRIGLHELRSRLAIIPQDPVLFSGSIRSNLDPLGTAAAAAGGDSVSVSGEDEVLWTALERCHLKETVASMAGGLDAAVAEGGSNLSQGERQLLCLGRALLRRAKVLVLDEATAAVDLATDALVQETIRREFAHCTVLTIAHRLHTVLAYDRILALHEGRVVEFDRPEALLADSSSLFHSLAKDAGLL